MNLLSLHQLEIYLNKGEMLTVMEEECMCSKLKRDCQQQNLTLSQVSGSLCPLCAGFVFIYLNFFKSETE